MQYYVGLDVSVKETSVCIIDKAGKVIREVRVATEPVGDLCGSDRGSGTMSQLEQ
jgi:predicted NBD/HSP70 family sugar kinase